MALTDVQKRAVSEILAHARRENLVAGARLPERRLEEVVKVSRSPIRAALAHLAKTGVVRHDFDRGYFMAVAASSLSSVMQEWADAAENPLYLRLAEERLRGSVANEVNEAELMRQLGASRNAIRTVLSRALQEGWVERRSGHGWSFLPMIDSLEAYEESYAFRIAIEPAGILSPKFNPNPAELEYCQRQQELIMEHGYRTMTALELFEAGSRFHEIIAKWSGNRFILQGVRRVNQLRRLVEYRMMTKHRPTRKAQANQHLAILEPIRRGDYLSAAALLRDHLNVARREKISSGIFPGAGAA